MTRSPRRRARRIALAATVGVLTIAGLVLGALAAVLYIAPISRFALDRALAAYNGVIPGEIRVAQFDGRLGTALCLEGVRLSDRDDRTLVAAESLCINWKPTSLLSGRLEVAELTATKLRIQVAGANGPGRFGDLAPAGDGEAAAAPEETPSERLGVALPLPVDVGLRVSGLDITGFDPSEGTIHYVRDGHLTAGITGREWEMTADISKIDGDVPIADIEIDSGEAGLAWNGRTLRADGLRVATRRGRVSSESISVDLREGAARGSIAAVGDKEAMTALTGLPFPTDPEARIDVSGSLASARVTARIDLDAHTSVRVDASGGVTPRLDIEATFAIDSTAPGSYLGVGAGRAVGEGTAHLEVHDDGAVSVNGQIACDRCRLPEIGQVRLQASLDVKRGAGRATAEIETARTAVDVSARLAGWRPERGSWRIRSEEIGPASRLAASIAGTPALTGGLRTEGSCGRPGQTLECSGTVTATGLIGDQFRIGKLNASFDVAPLAPKTPFDAEATVTRAELADRTIRRATVAVSGNQERIDANVTAQGTQGDRIQTRLTVRPGDEAVTLDLDALAIRIGDFELDLTQHARVTLGEDIIRVDSIVIEVAGGRVTANGRLAMDGDASDLRITARRIDLGALTEPLPGADITGAATLEARIRGSMAAPRIALDVDVERLSGRQWLAGDIDASLAYGDRRLSGEVTVTRRGRELAALTLSSPIDLRLQPAGAKLLPGRPNRIRLRMDRFALPLLRAISPELHIEGSLEVTAELAGTLNAPRGTVAARFHDLGWGTLPLGTGSLDVRYEDKRLVAAAAVKGGLVDTLAAEADIALDIDLTTQDGTLHLRDRPTLALRLEGLDLERIQDYYPSVALSGTLFAEATVSGWPDAPSAALRLETTPVTLSNRDVGTVRLVGGLDGQRASMALDVEQGARRPLHIDASVPIGFSAKGAPRWDRQRRHEVAATLVDFDVGAIRAALESLGDGRDPMAAKLPEQGRLSVSLAACGTPASPEVKTKLRVSDILWYDRRLAEGSAYLRYEQDRVLAAMNLSGADGFSAELHAKIPLNLALYPFSAKHVPTRPHYARVHIDGVTRALLAPVLDQRASVPAFTLGADLIAKGTLRQFTVDGDYNGHITHPRLGALRLTGALRADAADQRLKLELSRGTDALVSAAVEARARVPELIDGDASFLDTPFDGTLLLDTVPLGLLNSLLPPSYYDISGTLDGSVRAHGSPLDPRIAGRVSLAEGAVTIVPLNQRIADIQAVLSLDGQELTLSRLTFDSGKGGGTGKGRLRVVAPGTFEGTMGLALDHFPIVRPGVPEGFLSTQIDTALSHNPDETRVAVTISDTDITLLKRIGGNAPDPIPQSNNIVLVTGERRPLARAEEREADPEDDSRLVLTVDIADPIDMQGAGVEMNWNGRVSMTQIGDETEVQGRIYTNDGYFQFLGNDMWIEIGEVTLPEKGGTPVIYLVAHTDTSTAEVTITLQGRIDNPQFTLSSTPPLSQYEIVTLLVTGQPYSGTTRADTQILSQLSTLFLAARNPILQSEINRRLGVDYIGLTRGDNGGTPALVVGKRLSRKTYVQTRIAPNAPEDKNTATARIEYEFVPNWTLETHYGDANIGGLGVFWYSRYGATPRDAPDAEGEPDAEGAAPQAQPDEPQPTTAPAHE